MEGRMKILTIVGVVVMGLGTLISDMDAGLLLLLFGGFLAVICSAVDLREDK